MKILIAAIAFLALVTFIPFFAFAQSGIGQNATEIWQIATNTDKTTGSSPSTTGKDNDTSQKTMIDRCKRMMQDSKTMHKGMHRDMMKGDKDTPETQK